MEIYMYEPYNKPFHLQRRLLSIHHIDMQVTIFVMLNVRLAINLCYYLMLNTKSQFQVDFSASELNRDQYFYSCCFLCIRFSILRNIWPIDTHKIIGFSNIQILYKWQGVPCLTRNHMHLSHQICSDYQETDLTSVQDQIFSEGYFIFAWTLSMEPLVKSVFWISPITDITNDRSLGTVASVFICALLYWIWPITLHLGTKMMLV